MTSTISYAAIGIGSLLVMFLVGSFLGRCMKHAGDESEPERKPLPRIIVFGQPVNWLSMSCFDHADHAGD